MSARKVVVLGAGLAGLGFARHWPGCRVFEADGEPGGHARSHEFAGAWFDRGAHICHSQDEAWLKIVGAATPLHEMTKSVVLNHKAGHWFAYPVQNHLFDLPRAEREAALRDFLAAQEKYRGREPKNYEEWCRFQYGDFLLENFYRLYTAKYWHVPMAELATDWLGGRLLPSQVEHIVAGAQGPAEEKQAVFRTFRYPKRGGFFALLAPLAVGVDLHLNKRAIRVDAAQRVVAFADGAEESYDALVSTIPLPLLAAMIPDAPADVRAAAAKLRALRQYCVNFVVERENLSPANWFYIYDPDVAVSRVSFPFSLSGERNGRTAIQAEIFVPGDARPDENALREQAVADLGRLLEFSPADVSAAEIQVYPASYVVSDLERAAAVRHVREWLRGRGIETTGLFGAWEYIWSDRAFAGGRALAQALAGKAP
ncbi:MAG: NAD(P)/FAD-dependent oxidoreductase [Kiritimatiellia bacterium]